MRMDIICCCCSVTKLCLTLYDPMAAAHQVPLSYMISQSLLKFLSIESGMLSNHLILCYSLFLLPSIFPASGSSPMSWLFSLGGQSVGASASASVLLMNIQGWFPSGLTGLILLSKGLSRIFSSTTILKHQFFSAQPSYSATYQVHFNGLNVWDPAMIF